MVKLTLVGHDDERDLPIVEALDLETNEKVDVRNWFENAKKKWHFVLGKNSANRVYIAHNEFNAKAVDGEYIVEDKTTAPRKLGTSQPDKKLVPFMTEEDKAKYDAIIARAIENRNAQKAAAKPNDEEKIKAKIAKLTAELAELEAHKSAIDAE